MRKFGLGNRIKIAASRYRIDDKDLSAKPLVQVLQKIYAILCSQSHESSDMRSNGPSQSAFSWQLIKEQHFT